MIFIFLILNKMLFYSTHFIMNELISFYLIFYCFFIIISQFLQSNSNKYFFPLSYKTHAPTGNFEYGEYEGTTSCLDCPKKDNKTPNSGGNGGQSSCYYPSTTYFSDAKGSYHFKSNCYYLVS